MFSAVLSSAPPTAATFSFLFDWYFVSGLAAATVVIGLLVLLAVRYRAKDDESGPRRYKPESVWIPVAVVLIMGSVLLAAGYQTFASSTNIEIPKTGDAVTVKVLAFQWGWNFTYPNGAWALDNLTVPAGEVIILNITSKDVYHTLGIPMLAVKEDAIPGKINQLWFEVPQPAFYEDAIRCYQLCGIGHAYMIANLTVVSQAAWSAWMTSG
jgi:cytochrome c oxidase subunit 2